MDAKLAQELVQAIPLRKSVRTYTAEPLAPETKAALQTFIDQMDLPFAQDTRFAFFTAPVGKKLYNNGLNPPDNLALFAQTDLLSVTKAGFAGELVMLFAVRKGLGTCWFGHYKLAELGKAFEELATPERLKQSTLGYGYGKQVDVGERVICCMPVGHKDEANKRFVDRVAGANGARRKPLEQLMEAPDMLSAASPEVKAALNLARLAPSAANSQFWRFGISPDGKTLTLAKPVGYKHFKWEHPDVDIGMCAAHLWLGLLAQGLAPTVSVAMAQDRPLWTFGI